MKISPYSSFDLTWSKDYKQLFGEQPSQTLEWRDE